MATNKTSRRTHKGTFGRRVNTLVMGVATVVALTTLAIVLVVVGSKILYTQASMVFIHSDIERYESVRDSANENAVIFAGGPAGAHYRITADEADEKVVEISNKRIALRHSDDKLIAWAARNDFDFLTFLLGIFTFLSAAAVVAFGYLFFYEIRDALEFIFAVVMKVTFDLLAAIFYLVTFVLAKIYRFFSRVEKNRRNEWKKQRHTKELIRQGKVVPIATNKSHVQRKESLLSLLLRRHIG